ncbi:MAG: DUF4982 domain-containing protein [Bacteroidaceae bacterium]|nr:DUF4982 domain-containing protein [Bacteroidaceae bacterium]
MRNFALLATMLVWGMLPAGAQRTETSLEKGWTFIHQDVPMAMNPDYDDNGWEQVIVPHDWAIYGPFDRKHDLQKVAVTQNGEKVATWKTGRSGGLPYTGVGWYRTRFSVPEFSKENNRVTLLFDGAMSEAHVYINGKEAVFWPCGYNSFHCDVTGLLNEDGADNLLAVRLENREQSSRWYPGAGLYRHVHLITTAKTYIPVWGTYLTTPHVEESFATVRQRTSVATCKGEELTVTTKLYGKDGQQVGSKSNSFKASADTVVVDQSMLVEHPQLWSPEAPTLYTALTTVCVSGKEVDRYETRFGIRTVEVVAEKGFYLNGQRRKFKGVCNHHDLGPLGAAINVKALRHQLELLKEMGCDAVRTAHNMPAPELIDLCDEMGLMVMVEPFDEWDVAKCANGYHRYFKEWAERDMVNMLHNYRNHPSVVMWSIGNEVPTQCSTRGAQVASFLQNICHREDPTRPVTCGMDQVSCVLKNGFAAVLDVVGLNYRTHRYMEGYDQLPQGVVLGSETASTVSSRGVYKFPVQLKPQAIYDDNQCSGYDVEYCSWSNVPDVDFALADDHEWTMGQFVWTGFDYLGEPSPYDTDAWPNHSSMFGIIDLASIPKDRYYLYRSVWNTEEHTLHILPHWNWEGREGENVPVFVYTDYPEAELFINGKSYGKQRKVINAPVAQGKIYDPEVLKRYRLMWMDVTYEPGEVKVVAYDAAGNKAAEKVLRTAGKPHHLELVTRHETLQADGKDLAYVTVRVVDKDGNLCPTDNRKVKFNVKGAGKFRAAANGDATNLEQFHLPQMTTFSGQLTAIVQAGEQAGELTLTATASGVKAGKLKIQVK